jgi:hypothetical protein
MLLLAILAATTIHLSPAALTGLTRTSVKVRAHHSSAEATYEGVTLRALLTKNSVPAGAAIRGKALAWVVVAKANDGYQAVFALAELDPAFQDKLFLLADRKDGKPLPADEGPYRLIVPAEARQARWVRQLVTLTVRPVD